MRYTIFILSLLFPFLSIVAQPKHEVRAAWVTADGSSLKEVTTIFPMQTYPSVNMY